MSDTRRTPAPRGAIIASSIPGRVRLTIPARSANALAAMVEALESWPEVLEVQARPRTGSVIVRYETTATTSDALWAALDDAGVVRPGPENAPAAGGEPTGSAQRIRAAASSANAAVERGTGGSDLRLLVPLALGMQSLRQAAQGHHRLRDAPWYVLAWYAFETFMKFHAPPAKAGVDGTEHGRD